LPNRNSLATNATFRAAATELWNINKTGPYSSFSSHGGFLPLSVISNRTEALVHTLLSQDPAAFFPAGTDPTVIAGYEVRRNVSAHQLLGTKSAILEVPFDGESSFALILLKEQSRGTVFIAPNDDGTGRGAMEPVIDLRTFSNPIDIQFCLDMLRFWRDFHASPAMQEIFAPVEVSPGQNVVSDEDLTEFIRETIFASEGHPIGTAALGPVELGGVVRPDLTVHRTVGLSIADNSIMPLIPGTHTSSTAYAIGEKASLLIMARHS
jgi:choline dehydrogenase-like flavoprotein